MIGLIDGAYLFSKKKKEIIVSGIVVTTIYQPAKGVNLLPKLMRDQ